MVDKKQVIQDRQNGMSCKEVAERHGISMQYVSTITSGCCDNDGFKLITEKRCIYPHLRHWMNENKCSVTELVGKLYLSTSAANNVEKMSRILRGETVPKKDWIDALIEVTGMKYERLFAEKEGAR